MKDIIVALATSSTSKEIKLPSAVSGVYSAVHTRNVVLSALRFY